MTTLLGQLVGARTTGYVAMATFDIRVPPVKEGVFAAARRDTVVGADGRFALELPDAGERRGPITVTAYGPNGLPAGQEVVSPDVPAAPIEIEVVTAPATPVRPSPDITLGRQIRYSGRAIDPTGAGVPASLLVVVWARSGEGAPATPVSVTKTTTGGYFSAPWPSQRYLDAYGVLAGGSPIPILLHDDRLPLQLVLVSPTTPPDPAAGTDCACASSPPLASDPADLATNPEAYTADAGHCADFTVPDRTVDEVMYQAVVRTTQPQLKAATPQEQPVIPRALIDRITELAHARPVVDGVSSPSPEAGHAGQVPSVPFELPRPDADPPLGTGPTTTPTPVSDDAVLPAAVGVAARFLPGVDLGGRWSSTPASATARRVLRERARRGEPLHLEPSVLAEIARSPAELTPLRLIKGEQTSAVRRFRDSVGILARSLPGRFTLDPDHQIDWDELPDAYQATTIAHGHLLTLKQVFRAAGFSQGDVIYSLPLAPGQQKLVSMLDWNRTDVASRRAEQTVTEDLVADLTHDRDIADVIRSTLTESMRGRSHADTEAVGTAVAGFIGPVVFGAAGGVSSAGSTASQTSARAVTGQALQQVRDRTMQSASAVRGQRSTVVQSGRQGESVRAQTEVVANYNHCHSLTIQYFEVLRHLQVTQELAAVQECLFVPFAISPFTADKALRWRRQLERALRRPGLAPAFDSLERVQANWEGADVPLGRYADEPLVQIEGELWVRALLPRPADGELDEFIDTNWVAYADLLWDTPQNIFDRYLGVALATERDAIWDARIAPGVAQRLLEDMTLELIEVSGAVRSVPIDATMVSTFAQDRPMFVSLRANLPLPIVQRAEIERVRLSLSASNLPVGALMVVDSGTLRYRTDHLSHHLFLNRRILNDLTIGDDVDIITPLDTLEKRNPREVDVRQADQLLAHLDEHVEYYHRAIWLTMDPNRRYLLLDGFEAPDAGGRSVASVVENRVVGVVGNSLVMPVAPGQELDPTYEFAGATPRDLRHLYAADPAAPMRISLPTPGVYAEAVLGSCNSCEKIDDTRFWRWEDAPIPDRPVSIDPLSTTSRQTTPPSLAPDALPTPVVGYQTVPTAPDPTGLAAAVAALGTNDVFRDLTGLAMNQANAADALRSTMTAAQGFAAKAGTLAQQRFLNNELDRGLGYIKDAKAKNLISDDQASSLTEGFLRGAIGQPRPATFSATAIPSMQRAIERVPTSDSGHLSVVRPGGTVDITVGSSAATVIDASVTPSIVPLQQKSNLVCWATAGTIMECWRRKESVTVESVLDGLGGTWRSRYDQNRGLSLIDFRAFFTALNLLEDPPLSYTPDGLARLLSEVGPLLAIGDDAIQNNLMVHARIVDSVKGDGTLDGTTVMVADMATTALVPMTFRVFDQLHGANDPVALGVGLFHY
jgi:hypothetical protein